MQLRDTFKMAMVALSSHKSRSVLTILGIVIGITSIMLVMAIGKSAEQLILSQIEAFGPNNVFVLPGRQPEGFTEGAASILTDSLRMRDYKDLQKKEYVPDAVSVTPIVFGPALISYESEVYNGMIMGSTPNAFELFDIKIILGDTFSEEDANLRATDVVIGDKVRKELFGPNDPIDQSVKIKGRTFRVVGVMEPKGQSSFLDFNEIVMMPFTSAQTYILGIRHFHRIVVEANSVDNVSGIVKDIEVLLRDNHSISDPKNDDFFVTTQEDLIEQISMVTTVLTVLLSSVAAISLVVGGIGIMNIMLVSVTERTKEIGLRKALGARNNDILVQFLVEAVMLTVSGGLIGIALGILFSVGATYGANYAYDLGFEFQFPYVGMTLGVLVSSVVGFVFGIFPARQAAQKSPIESLR